MFGVCCSVFGVIHQQQRTMNPERQTPMNISRLIAYITVFVTLLGVGCQAPEVQHRNDLPEVVDFNFHVKPILSDRCFQCHGPDANKREANLRLDEPTSAIKERLESGGRAIVPGNARKSELYRRIISEDPEHRMPPEESNLTLSTREIALLTRWIEDGADYTPHWSFLPVQEPAVPAAKESEWGHNPIDQFVYQKLREQGLQPEPEADKETLLRRVSLDLTGLPPTIDEIDTFLSDDRPDAYEHAVDRLMHTDAYAERMALEWMDIARYADSHGYSLDGYRYMWPWRDWVIQAFKTNMPYDQFVTWQLAGDLLPNASREQRLATAFLRNQRLNAEGGIVPEEYLVEYAVDRTATAGTAFMGLTMECARCHDHKYDPISQKEFYQFYAFFNNVNELGEIRGDGNDGPQVLMGTAETDTKLAALEEQIVEIEQRIQAYEQEALLAERPEAIPSLKEGLLSWLDFDDLDRGRLIDNVDPSRGFELPELEQGISGQQGYGLKFTPFEPLQFPIDVANFDRADPFAFSFWINPHTTTGSMSLLMKMSSKNDSQRGYEIALTDHRLAVQLISSYPANRIEVRSTQAIQSKAWTHVVVSYNGSGTAEGLSIFIDGQKVPHDVLADQLSQSIDSKARPRPLRIGWKWQYQPIVDQGYALIDDLRIYGDRTLTRIEVAELYRNSLDQSTSEDPPVFTNEEKLDHNLARKDTTYLRLRENWLSLLKQRNGIQDTLAGVMVMEDLQDPRPTYILDRGTYDAPLEQVYPATPVSILPYDETLPLNRLGLARWLFDERHPLTSRVAVNRYWQLFFEKGLVATPEDFGNQGALPSHPQLLDWLAMAFIKSEWDVRAVQKMIVMSATYRQRSIISKEKREADPENTWLSRGPRHRLSAEMLRDQALAASGLLVRKVGGPGVKPYQPPGLWAEKSEFTILREYVPDTGPDQYRRAMYTFWRRTSPPPAMILFDAPTRDNCIVRRQQTSTPFQALVLLNDPQFVEAARVLAQRIMAEHKGDVSKQIALGYRLLTGTQPEKETLSLLIELFNSQAQGFKNQRQEASDLLSVGNAPIQEGLDRTELAAMTVVSNTIMSFQESVYKQ